MFRSKTLQLHTTRSWDFLGLTLDSEVTPCQLAFGDDIIVGVFDTGFPISTSPCTIFGGNGHKFKLILPIQISFTGSSPLGIFQIANSKCLSLVQDFSLHMIWFISHYLQQFCMTQFCFLCSTSICKWHNPLTSIR